MGDEGALLFVYGTLRRGFDGPMAARLAGVSAYCGAGQVRGRLYRVADYPGFVPGQGGWVMGDLVRLDDPAAAWPVLDAHEECGAGFPEPQEYRRERLEVETAAGPVESWTYIYARDPAGLPVIAGGDFLA